jgi:hypothetical protein
MPYTTNWLNSMNGHLGYDTGGDGGGITKKQGDIRTRTSADDRADIADIIANTVGGGYKSISDQDIRGDYVSLVSLVGRERANQLMQKIFVFNQDDSLKGKTPQEKLKSFYSTRSSDSSMNQFINQVGSVAMSAGFSINQSSNIGSQRLTGRDIVNKGTATPMQLNELKTYNLK